MVNVFCAIRVTFMLNLVDPRISEYRHSLRRTGASPQCQGDLNTTIELVFSKLKALLRKAAARAPVLWTQLGHALHAFNPRECQNFFRYAGYPYTKSKTP